MSEPPGRDANRSCRHRNSRAETRLLLPDLAPALFVHFDAMLVCGFLDAPPGGVALVVADAFDLVEAGDRVADVAGVVERFLALLGERELILVQAIALLFVELGHEASSLPAVNERRAR